MCKNVLAEIWWQSLARFCGRFTILISPARPIYERERERVSCPSPLEGERTRTYERDFRSLELSATFLTRPRFLDSREYRTRATSTCIGRRSSSHFISRTLTSSIYLYNRVCRFIMHGELMYRTRARRSSRRAREKRHSAWMCVGVCLESMALADSNPPEMTGGEGFFHYWNCECVLLRKSFFAKT